MACKRSKLLRDGLGNHETSCDGEESGKFRAWYRPSEVCAYSPRSGKKELKRSLRRRYLGNVPLPLGHRLPLEDAVAVFLFDHLKLTINEAAGAAFAIGGDACQQARRIGLLVMRIGQGLEVFGDAPPPAG